MREHVQPPASEPEVDAPAPLAQPGGPAAALRPAQVLALQRTAGNAAVTALLRAPAMGEAPTIPAPGVAAEPEKRYDFEVAIYDKPMHFHALTPVETVQKLRMLWRLVHDELDEGRAENQRLVQRREEHSIVGFWADLFGGAELPDPDMWNEVGRGPLTTVMNVLNATDAALQATWGANEAAVDRGLAPGLETNPYMRAALAFDATHERISEAVALLERAVADLHERQRRLDEYVEGSTKGAQRAITGIKISIVVLAAAAGGAGAGFAGEGAGLLAQAGASAGTAGVLGASQELFTQVGEMRIGEREHFDFALIAKRGAKDVVLGFVGGVVGGKFTGVMKNAVGGWVGGLSKETLAAYGIAREELLTNGEKLFIEWVAGSVATSPFTTAAGAVMDRAMDGKWQVATFGDFTSLVFDDMVRNGALGGFLHYAGHAVNPAGAHAGPAEPEAPVIEESPPPGFEPTTDEPAPDDYGPEPEQVELDPEVPVIEESPPPGFPPETEEPAPDDYGPEPEQEELDLEKIGPVDETSLGPPPMRAAGAPPSAARPLTEEESAGRGRGIKRARPYNVRPPRGTGGGRRRRATPVRETRVKQDRHGDHLHERRFHGSVAEVRKDAAAKLKAAYDRMVEERQEGGPREIDGLIAEIRRTDPAFADRVRRYYEAIEDPQFLEDAMARLWEQARRNHRTVAGELEHILGGPDPQLNEFENTPGLGPEEEIAEFREAVRDPRTLIDLSNSGDYHGSHTHAFQQYLGDLLFGRGEGARFRMRLADLTGPGRTVRTDAGEYTEAFWAQVWDEVFDSTDDSLHSTEVLGKILQHALDFPRWDT